jgi:uncharacterized membrane protein YfcA
MAMAALAGAVRGATGFGQALIFVPLAGLLYPPATAVPLLWVAGAAVTPLMLRPHLRSTDWPEVLQLACGAALMLPFGVWLLGHVSAVDMRWIICTLVLGCTLALAAGWSIRLPQGRAFGLLLGGMSGLSGGATGMGGPPLVLCWLSGRSDAAAIRSNIFVYLWLLSLMELITGALSGLVPQSILIGGLMLAPAYGGGILVGNRVFRHSARMSPERRDKLFRWVALGICAVSACAGLPVWR